MKINQLGMIEGGVCEKMFRARLSREEGAKFAWNWLLSNKCVKIESGWYIICRFPRKIISTDFVISLHLAEKEVGWWRFMCDVVRQLYKDGRKFRLKWMKGWIEGIAAFELGIGTVDGSVPHPHDLEILDMLQGESKHKFGYAPPHQPKLFKKWRIAKELAK